MKNAMAPTSSFRKYANDFWQQRSPDKLTVESVNQIILNLAAYARLLEDWGSKESGETILEHQNVVQS